MSETLGLADSPMFLSPTWNPIVLFIGDGAGGRRDERSWACHGVPARQCCGVYHWDEDRTVRDPGSDAQLNHNVTALGTLALVLIHRNSISTSAPDKLDPGPRGWSTV